MIALEKYFNPIKTIEISDKEAEAMEQTIVCKEALETLVKKVVAEWEQSKLAERALWKTILTGHGLEFGKVNGYYREGRRVVEIYSVGDWEVAERMDKLDSEVLFAEAYRKKFGYDAPNADP